MFLVIALLNRVDESEKAILRFRELGLPGGEMEALILTLVTLHELVGPLLSRRGLIQSGEVVTR